MPIFNRNWKEVITFWLGRSDVYSEKKDDFIHHLKTFDDGCGGFLRTQALMSAEDGIVEYLEGGQATNIKDIDSQIKKLRMILGLDKPVFIPRRNSVATEYYKKCFDPTNTSLPGGDDYAVEEYTDEQIKAIIAIANNCDQDSPILWRALELGEIAKKLGNGRKEIKNEIVAFILSKILPSLPPYLLELQALLKNTDINSEEKFLNILNFLLQNAPQGEFIFWKAFYQLNKLDKSDWEPSSVLKKLYPLLDIIYNIEQINDIAVELQNALCPPIPELRRADVTEQIHAAAFGLENIEDIASYLQYIFGEANFNKLTNIVFNSLRKYIQNANPAVSNSSTASNNVSNPLEPEEYKKLYELRLVHYLFDGDIFNDLLDENLQNRQDLERYRDCFKTIYYSSLLLTPQEFYSEWNNVPQPTSGFTLPSS